MTALKIVGLDRLKVLPPTPNYLMKAAAPVRLWVSQLKASLSDTSYLLKVAEPLLLFGLLLLLWWRLPAILQNVDGTTGSIDQSIWLLIVLGLISFLLITAMCWWLLRYSWQSLGLPGIDTMVSQFNTLELWQQLSFFWASLALLQAAAICSLSAIL